MGLTGQADLSPAALPLVNAQLSMHEREVISEPLLTGIKVPHAAVLTAWVLEQQGCKRRCVCAGSRRPDAAGQGPVPAAHRPCRLWQNNSGPGRRSGPTPLRRHLRLCSHQPEVPSDLDLACCSRHLSSTGNAGTRKAMLQPRATSRITAAPRAQSSWQAPGGQQEHASLPAVQPWPWLSSYDREAGTLC